MIRIAIDPIFPPPLDFYASKKFIGELLPENRFELIFDEMIDSKTVGHGCGQVLSNIIIS